MDNFKNLEAWKKTRVLTREVYRETQAFPKAEIFGLTQQMRRAAVSAACNIAEAHGRNSNKERIQFLHISRGSLLELEAQTLIATDLEFMRANAAEPLQRQIEDATRLVTGLIRYYRDRSS